MSCTPRPCSWAAAPHGKQSAGHTTFRHCVSACYRTFTTPYAGSLRLRDDSATAAPDTSSAAAADWQASATGPDLALLTARDPILFFAEVPLYESELDDNGTAQLSVKVDLRCSVCQSSVEVYMLKADAQTQPRSTFHTAFQ
jgi:TIP41-like family